MFQWLTSYNEVIGMLHNNKTIKTAAAQTVDTERLIQLEKCEKNSGCCSGDSQVDTENSCVGGAEYIHRGRFHVWVSTIKELLRTVIDCGKGYTRSGTDPLSLLHSCR